MLKSIGGAGATTIATHLAASLAAGRRPGARGCVIDLDLQAGDVASYLGVSPNLTLSDLLEAEGRLDDELLAAVACKSTSGVDVIAAPADIVPIESLDFDQLERLLNLARRHYDFVLLDLPYSFTNWSVSSVFGADLALLVTTLTIPSLRHAKRQLEFLVSMGLPARDLQIVINRTERRLFKTIDASDAAEALRHPILASISDEPKLLRLAQDQGELAFEIDRRSRFARDVAALAQEVEKRLEEAS